MLKQSKKYLPVGVKENKKLSFMFRDIMKSRYSKKQSKDSLEKRKTSHKKIYDCILLSLSDMFSTLNFI